MKRRPLRPSFDHLELRDVPAVGLAALLNVPAAAYSANGTGNNAANSTWGSAGSDLLRIAPAGYADGLSAPAGADRPSAREISNVVSAQGDVDTPSAQRLSAMVYAWGQFIDHDMDLTPTGGTDLLSIQVPTGDPSFDPNSTGTQIIPTTRSIFDPNTGTTNARQQINKITSFLDGSMIYGSDATTAADLRTFQGGLMKTSAGNMLPLNNAATIPGGPLPMANDAQIVPQDQLFAAGDVRANENIELTSLQTLFVREHNYWAGQIAKANPKMSDEGIYQRARAIVIGEIQSITYNQWLPALLGHPLAAYTGYKANVNPGISNEFSTAAFRFGHSMVGDDIEFLDNNGNEVRDSVPFSQAFFYPPLLQQTGIDPLLKYLSSDPSQEIDTKVVDSLRNFLFGPPGAGGLDLASLNIERGRDNGLADYNSIRAAFGLAKVTSFDQITSDLTLQSQLAQLYTSVDDIDPWVGMLAEDHLPGGSVGPTLAAVFTDQFTRLRDGDAFWYQRTFSGPLLQMLQQATLADIIRRDSGITNLQPNVFFFRAQVTGTIFADSNGDHLAQTVERHIAGMKVDLVDRTSGDVVASTTSDSRGNFLFTIDDGLRTGQYLLRTVPAAGDNWPAVRQQFNVTRGDEAPHFAMAVQPPRVPTQAPPPQTRQGAPMPLSGPMISLATFDMLFAQMGGPQGVRRR